jgi:hypothetical protein
MGPIDGDPAEFERLTQLMYDSLMGTSFGKPVNMIEHGKHILDVDPFTRGMAAGGPAPENIARSSARVLDPSNFDGMKTKDVAKSVQSMSSEQEILRAAQALANPANPGMPAALSGRGGVRIPPFTPRPQIPIAPAIHALGNLNPLLTFIDLLTQATDLNQGEHKELAKRTQMPATIDPGQRKGK